MRRAWIHLAVVALPVLQGCYTYAPLETSSVPVGETVQLTVSDRGRVELGDRLGRGVSAIEGRVAEATAEQYAINVSAVTYLNGERNRWSGEQMRLDRGNVERVNARKLSKQRTWIAAAAASAVVVAFIMSRGLFGIFGGESSEGSGDPPPASLLPRFGFSF